jgi:hypothetical protein
MLYTLAHNTICCYLNVLVRNSNMNKASKTVLLFACLGMLTLSSCKMWNNLFGPKYGCPGNGKNVGAERIVSGEKVPKAKKFRS